MSMATTVLKAEQYSVVNIKWKWDTDGDEELFDSLPEEIVLPLCDGLWPLRTRGTRTFLSVRFLYCIHFPL